MFAAHGTQADENENGLLLQSINAPVGKLWLVPQPQRSKSSIWFV